MTGISKEDNRFEVTFLPRQRCLIKDHESGTIIRCTVTEAIGLSWAIRSEAGDRDAPTRD